MMLWQEKAGPCYYVLSLALLLELIHPLPPPSLSPSNDALRWTSRLSSFVVLCGYT